MSFVLQKWICCSDDSTGWNAILIYSEHRSTNVSLRVAPKRRLQEMSKDPHSHVADYATVRVILILQAWSSSITKKFKAKTGFLLSVNILWGQTPAAVLTCTRSQFHESVGSQHKHKSVKLHQLSECSQTVDWQTEQLCLLSPFTILH